jgi:hypothetical protein
MTEHCTKLWFNLLSFLHRFVFSIWRPRKHTLNGKFKKIKHHILNPLISTKSENIFQMKGIITYDAEFIFLLVTSSTRIVNFKLHRHGRDSGHIINRIRKSKIKKRNKYKQYTKQTNLNKQIISAIIIYTSIYMTNYYS